ncbi:hypothetical protein ACEXQD_04355 [Herbiconiux sp. P15]|uniref:hypothetical protein n=1 Tax=Herbiconiux liukaitaii TaxID=3342799 RepID=UPI0035BAB003
MQAPSTKTRRLIVFGAAPVAILAAGVLIWTASFAAFSAQTRNVGSNWDTGSVTLSDDDLGAAAFQITNVTPGQTGSQCIRVTSTSSVPGTVKLYVDRLGAQGLENNILISTEIGDGGTFGSCTTFVPSEAALPPVSLATAAADYVDFATGVLPWTTTGDTAGEFKTYRVSWTFDTTGLTQVEIDALQGKSVSADVVWELQSN